MLDGISGTDAVPLAVEWTSGLLNGVGNEELGQFMCEQGTES